MRRGKRRTIGELFIRRFWLQVRSAHWMAAAIICIPMYAVAETQADLSAILAQAVDYGHPQLAEEAQTYLEAL